MSRSMTAYAKVQGRVYNKNLVIELHSVNKKGLDIHSYLPKEFLFIDVHLKKWISQSTYRGQVSLKVSFEASSEMEKAFNVELLKKVDRELMSVAKGVGFTELRPYSFPFLIEEAQKFAVSDVSLDKEAVLQEIEPIMLRAITDWNAMKMKEGAFLVKDLEKRLEIINALQKKMSLKKDSGPDRLHKKLETIFEELEGKLSDEDRRRLLKEVVIYAEKLDISEELTRLEAHLTQFTIILRSDKVDVGKTLDFFVQEMLRESNTIASKASDVDLIHTVLEVKGELEKIREQVQNIE